MDGPDLKPSTCRPSSSTRLDLQTISLRWTLRPPSDDQIGVRCRIDTRNAYGVSTRMPRWFRPPCRLDQSCNDIMGPFVELIGFTSGLPHPRGGGIAGCPAVGGRVANAVSSAWGLALSSAEPPAEQEVPDGLLAMGTVQVTNDDNSVTQVAGFFVDAATVRWSRLGDADGDAHELLDADGQIGARLRRTQCRGGRRGSGLGVGDPAARRAGGA